MDERACYRKNLNEGMIVMYSKTEDATEEKWLQGIIEYIEGKSGQEFAEHGHIARFTNGDIGFVKQIIDSDKIDSEHILNLIKIDENQKLEFKETFSVNNETGEKLKCLKDATVKEIAAFMNTSGGTLLIGISNDKKIIGIERDLKIIEVDKKKKETADDKFKRSVEDIIKERLKDPNIFNYFDIHLISAEENGIEKTVCVIKVKKSKKPIFMNMDITFTECGTNRQKSGIKQIFYTRTPDSKVREVEPRELQDFIKQRF